MNTFVRQDYPYSREHVEEVIDAMCLSIKDLEGSSEIKPLMEGVVCLMELKRIMRRGELNNGVYE